MYFSIVGRADVAPELEIPRSACSATTADGFDASRRVSTLTVCSALLWYISEIREPNSLHALSEAHPTDRTKLPVLPSAAPPRSAARPPQPTLNSLPPERGGTLRFMHRSFRLRSAADVQGRRNSFHQLGFGTDHDTTSHWRT